MKSKRAWAVVNKENPVIRINDIFDSKDIIIQKKTEKIIQVEIKEVK